MNSLLAVLGVCVCVVVAGVAPLSAQTVPAPPAPRIFSVVPDLSGTTLVVSGIRFGEGAEVWVDGQLVPVLPGATDERLEIDVPAAWRVRPGTYRLVVRTSNGRTDSFEVTVDGGAMWSATDAGPEGRPVELPNEARPGARPGADPPRRADTSSSDGTRPRTPPNLFEGQWNTAVGIGALASITSGRFNVATGYAALNVNTEGYSNTAAGDVALGHNTTGSDNTAAGMNALGSNTIGAQNTAAGYWALLSNTTGYRNVALGYQAGSAQTIGSDNVYVANAGVAGESGRIRIGTAGTHTDTYLAGTVRATAFVGAGAGLTNVAASDLACTGCVAASEVSFTYAGSASAGGPATSALTATTATSATTATTAANASALGGLLPSAYSAASHTHTQFGSMVLQGSPGQNTALGVSALAAVSTGTANLALGYRSLYVNTTGAYNTGLGSYALTSNTTGFYNTATGSSALVNNTTGSYNTAAGREALLANTTGWANTAAGYEALYGNTTGANSTAAGFQALASNTTGANNTADGFWALRSNTTGSRNVAVGTGAGSAQTTGSDNVYVANAGVAGESGKIRIGTAGTHSDTYLTGTVHVTALVYDGIVVDPGGGPPHSPLPPIAAGSRAEVHPDAVTRNARGQVESAGYDPLPMQLMGELQKQQARIAAQEATITGQADRLAAQAVQLAGQADQLAAQAGQVAAQAQQMKAQAQREVVQDQLLKALQSRLAQLEARLAPARPGGTR